jgi:hypothetical protein
METNVTDEEIEKAFTNTNFGNRDHRKLIEQGILKLQGGYISGHTLTVIMRELGLISEKSNVLKKGRRFIFSAFYDQNNTG